MRLEGCLDQRTHESRFNCFRPRHFDRIPSPTGSVDLSCLSGQTDIRSSFESLNNADRQTEDCSEQLWYSRRRIAGPQTPDLDEAFRGAHSSNVFIPAFSVT